MDLTFTQQLQQFIAAHPILIFAWVALVVAILFNFYKGVTSKYKIVENAQATQLVNKEEGLFLDLRSEDEFRAGHIVESHHILPSEIKANNVHPIEKYKDRPVILVDNNGFSAGSSADLLSKQGFAKVYVLKEGILGWKAANLPTVKKHK
ncbi:rhodanese-like domain-containing protein [Actinobacillus pleuropneumoniae]|uniref:Rhodanese-related sulfurtransferase n=4 Tax=Actinobacillus pleuropneumoniae TaxID=715 RepID=B0BRA1_ACTPJ|nr:rhodanese-like domain-containing protein [Actinobacillus pleuropneumoniae]ABY70086.1 rhodanese-related sulfurtransferase [Actinobacillus pleuropneumoniae serovar 3 str. JL03]ACE62220.1 putative Rhodanese-related sulfurtransferase [Actinobacillus pleuropneumoniae serovar 7 str. AP76]EFL79700.1 rhodanese-related sulfurtransferase [Actinobacillus pleuropneumoniae serovar 6 str. Femo]EFM89308.1 Rhodanese-related sulfurtransferase [Actinobacillus pleuropneumoniae serovar 4 str. M62]EFM91404.1 Rh